MPHIHVIIGYSLRICQDDVRSFTFFSTISYANRMMRFVNTISIDIAAAAATSPASSMLTSATAAKFKSAERRNTTAETVTIELTKKNMAISTIAGKHIGTVTFMNVL